MSGISLIALALLTAACTTGAGAGVTSAPPAPEEPAAGQESTPIEDDRSALPDVSARPISRAELEAMLPAGDTGPAASDSPTTMARSNEDLVVTAVLDRADEAEDIVRHERVTGVGAAYPQGDATSYVWIDMFNTPEGASGWVGDTAGDVVKRAGGSHGPAVDVTSAASYPFGLGQSPVGMVLTLDGGARTETVAMFSVGRLAVFASIVRSDAADMRVPVQYLAEEVQNRILSVLLGTEVEPPPSRGPESFEFEFERTVTTADGVWFASATGVVSGSDVQCSVSVDEPHLNASRDFVRIGGRVWARSGSAPHEAIGSAGAVDRSLLTLCPAWPVDVGEAGLQGVLASTPAVHVIGGVEAAGYRGVGTDLESALGLEAGTADVNVFNVWLAADTTWIVELDVTLSGDPLDLAQVIGTGFAGGQEATVHITQRVSKLDDAGPVTPPG